MSNNADEKHKLECENLRLRNEELAGRWWKPMAAFLPTLLAIAALFTAWSTGLFEHKREKLADQRDLLKHEIKVHKSVADMLVHSSTKWMNEPSGLSASGLSVATDWKVRPLAVGIDDDEPAVFILHSLVKDQTGILRQLDFDLDDGEPIEDLEAICYNPEPEDGPQYYAITSHRIFNSERGECCLFSFDIEETRLDDPTYTVTATTVLDLAPALLLTLKEMPEIVITGEDVDEKILVNKRDWKEKVNEREAAKGKPWYPYAVEIEGLAYVEGSLLIGLKLPLASVNGKKNAILLQFDLNKKVLSKLALLPLSTDREDVGYGISALAYDSESEKLLVAANPPAKPREDDSDDDKCLGKSKVFVFPYSDSVLKENGEPYNAGEDGFKLEGLAVIGDEVWLAYEAKKKSHFAQRKGKDFGIR